MDSAFIVYKMTPLTDKVVGDHLDDVLECSLKQYPNAYMFRHPCSITSLVVAEFHRFEPVLKLICQRRQISLDYIVEESECALHFDSQQLEDLLNDLSQLSVNDFKELEYLTNVIKVMLDNQLDRKYAISLEFGW